MVSLFSLPFDFTLTFHRDEQSSPRDSSHPGHGRRWSRSNPNPNPNQQPSISHGRSSSINNQRVPSSSSVFDAGSSDSDGNEVLPMSRNLPPHYNHQYQASRDMDGSGPGGVSGSHGPQGSLTLLPGASTTSLRQAGEAWFHAVDERYLLPLFSNAVASRTFHARRARANRATRRAVVPEGAVLNGLSPSHQQQFQHNIDEEEYGSWPGSPAGSGTASPVPGEGSDGVGATVRGAVKRKNQEVLRSIGSFWRGTPVRGHAALPQDEGARANMGSGTGTSSPVVVERVLEAGGVGASALGQSTVARPPIVPGGPL